MKIFIIKGFKLRLSYFGYQLPMFLQFLLQINYIVKNNKKNIVRFD